MYRAFSKPSGAKVQTVGQVECLSLVTQACVLLLQTWEAHQMRWTTGDRGNIQDMRGRSGGMGFTDRRHARAAVGLADGRESFRSSIGCRHVERHVGLAPDRNASQEEQRSILSMRWRAMFRKRGRNCCLAVSNHSGQRFPRLLQSTCGRAGSASGPFYCRGSNGLPGSVVLRRASQRFAPEILHRRT